MVDIRGGEGFKAAARQLRDVQGLRRELQGGLGDAGAKLVEAARANARATLPKRGGYAEQVADTTKFKVELLISPRGPWLRITATGPDYRLDKKGRLRHPVYAKGPRSQWNWAKKDQPVKPHWFTDTARDNEADVRVQLVAAVTRYVRQPVRRR